MKLRNAVTWLCIAVIFTGCSKKTAAENTALTQSIEKSKQQQIELRLDNAKTSITALSTEIESLRQEIFILKQQSEDETTTHSQLSEVVKTDVLDKGENGRSSVAKCLFGLFLIFVVAFAFIMRRSGSEKN